MAQPDLQALPVTLVRPSTIACSLPYSWCSLPQRVLQHLFFPYSWQVQADGTDGNCVTFVLHDEDHTLGNSLRYMVMKK